MNKLLKNPGKGKKRKSSSLEQKIDAAQKKKAKLLRALVRQLVGGHRLRARAIIWKKSQNFFTVKRD